MHHAADFSAKQGAGHGQDVPFPDKMVIKET
jgi:hypothetical protein